MTGTTTILPPADTGRPRHGHGVEHAIELKGVRYRLRLVRTAGGWMASVDTVDGPSMAVNASPYLAVSLAIEPVGGQLMDALVAVSELAPAISRVAAKAVDNGGTAVADAA